MSNFFLYCDKAVCVPCGHQLRATMNEPGRLMQADEDGDSNLAPVYTGPTLWEVFCDRCGEVIPGSPMRCGMSTTSRDTDTAEYEAERRLYQFRDLGADTPALQVLKKSAVKSGVLGKLTNKTKYWTFKDKSKLVLSSDGTFMVSLTDIHTGA